MSLTEVSINATIPEAREVFESGNPDLDQWLRHTAINAETRGTARVHCLVDDNSMIVGYYSLNAHVVASDDLPSRQGRGLPAQVSTVLIGKLARDRSAKSDGIGELLLAAAHRSIVLATQTVAARFVVVDAIDDNAKGFYEHFGYRPMPTNPHRLYRRIKDIAAEQAN